MHIIFLSSGITSWVAGLRVVERYGKEQCIGVFADTGVEDPDNYRFLEESTAFLGIPLVRVFRETLWENWKRNNAIPNNHMSFCSRQLKQEPCRKWLKENSNPDTDTLYVGISWDEIHRCAAIERGWNPWKVEFPMCEAPYLDKPHTLKIAREHGIEPPRLYLYGVPHANCGGACVRAGIGQWQHILKALPDVFAVWEQKEAEMQAQTGKNCTILIRQVRGEKIPYSLRELRENTQNQLTLFDDNWGGCGCFTEHD